MRRNSRTIIVETRPPPDIMSTLDCMPNFASKNVKFTRKSTSMETLVGDDVETDSGLNFFADGSNSNAFVRSIKQQRREEKKYVAAPVHNIPQPPVVTRNTLWNYPEYRNFTDATRLLQNGLDFSKDPAPGI